MSEWTDGYVADIGYTFGYYTELNPLRVRLAFLHSGLAVPEIRTACELGFGQGVSVNMHAAASTAQWHGNDFNPSQAVFAQELASVAGTNAQLTDASFAELVARDDLPKFDYIGLHGIWSWINDENRATIVEFIRRQLNVGGVVYISYNTLPGWAPFAPVRHLLNLHAETMGSAGQGSVGRIDSAFAFADKLLAANPLYARANPNIVERFKGVKGHTKNYVAHEYFNRDWQPMHFSTLAEKLESVKLQFACSAHYLDHVEPIHFTPEQSQLLAEIQDVTLKETARDFLGSQYFRRDYWAKGVRRLDPLERWEALRAQKVVLIKYRPEVALKISGALGEVALNEAIYNPLLDLLADHKPRSLGQIEQAMKEFNVGMAQVLQAVMLLAGAGHLQSIQEADAVAKVRKNTDKFNLELMKRARGNGDVQHLVSPLTGGGVPVQRFYQLFLMAIGQGKRQPAEWAQFVWQVLASQGQSIVKEGKTLATPEENQQELLVQATDFEKKHLPILKALMIAA